MVGEIISRVYKEGEEFIDSYPPEAAIWCNQNEHYIEEYPENSRHFIIRKIVHTDEEYIEQIRNIRDIMLKEEVDPILCNPIRYSALTAEEKEKFLAYRQYLCDIPESVYFPYADANKSILIKVLTYSEWLESFKA